MRIFKSFEEFWLAFSNRSINDREEYLKSLTPAKRKQLLKSFSNDGWLSLFVQDIIDNRLDFIKSQFKIDLFELRINAIKNKKVFLIERSVWDIIEQLIFEYEEYYDTNILFGGLIVCSWGKEKQFYKIRSR